MLKNHGNVGNHRSHFTALPKGRMVLTKRDLAVLVDVFLQRALTRKQLMRLGHFNSVTAANLRLRVLFDHGYLKRSVAPVTATAAETIYYLGSPSVNELTALLGVSREEVVRVVNGDRPFALAHAIAVADARIALVTSPPHGVQAVWIAEPEARHEYGVQTPNGMHRHILKPDGAIQIQSGDTRHLKFIEVDRGHVSQPQFKLMCESYIRYTRLGLLSESYGVDSAETLCIVHAGDRRLAHLIATAGAVSAPMRFTTWSDIVAGGIYGKVWLTPGKADRSTFLGGDL